MYKGELEISNELQPNKKMTVEGLASKLSLNLDTVRRAVESLRSKGFVRVEQEDEIYNILTPEAEKCIKKGEMIEYSVYKKALEGKSISDLNLEEKSFGLKHAKGSGLITIEGGKLKHLANPDKAKQINDSFISKLLNPKTLDAQDLSYFSSRSLVSIQKKSVLYVSGLGKNLESGSDFGIAATKDAELGKNHPLTILSKRVKRIFAELGFEEMDGSIIESSFWNFDALFQPQDHPARDLADTFYLKGASSLPDNKLVQKVKIAHEKGWKYKWKEEDAKKLLLRTHTTALSARYLADLKSTPKKYFAVGRVFRNEATDYKHLAEFHQVEGVVAWENATFRDLLGILKEFYAKLGFDKIRFRPSFFPYTEPSLEVEVYFEPRKQWMELGGAGIARPEVSISLSGIYPVLLWGLSLERPLMLSMGLDDIRTFYKNDLEWLKSARV